MTFHNLQSSLIYCLKTQEIACQRLCISKFSQGASPGPPSAFSRCQRRSAPVLNSSLRACCTPSVIKWYRFFVACFFRMPPYYLPSNEVPPQFENPGDATGYRKKISAKLLLVCCLSGLVRMRQVSDEVKLSLFKGLLFFWWFSLSEYFDHLLKCLVYPKLNLVANLQILMCIYSYQYIVTACERGEFLFRSSVCCRNYYNI